MKYFRVEEEYMEGYAQRAEVDVDGDAIGESYEAYPLQHITLGYNVFELDEDGMTENAEFYPVQTDMRTFKNNHAEVLAQIKQDYSADKWHNHNW